MGLLYVEPHAGTVELAREQARTFAVRHQLAIASEKNSGAP